MSDLSAKIAEMLYTGEGLIGLCENNNFARIVNLIHEHYPEATIDEIMRGFRISIELLKQEEAEAMAGDRP